jgi:hypothetical protein
MSHGASRRADSIQRTAQVCLPRRERHIARAEPSAHGRHTPGRPASVKAASRRSRARIARALTGVGWSGSDASKRSWLGCVVMCSAVALDCESDGTHCVSRKQRLSAIRKLGMGIQSERTLLKLPKSGSHLVLTQCADIDSRANRPSKPCLLLSCYQAVGCLRLAGPAPSFAKPPSDKGQDKRDTSRFSADLAQLICRVFVERRCSSCLVVDRGQNARAAAVLLGIPELSKQLPLTRFQFDRSLRVHFTVKTSKLNRVMVAPSVRWKTLPSSSPGSPGASSTSSGFVGRYATFIGCPSKYV